MEIREAHLPEEYDSVLDLITELQGFIAALDPVRLVKTAEDFDKRAYVDHVLARMHAHDGALFLALEGDQVLGLIVGGKGEVSGDEVMDSYPHTFGEVYEFVVREGARGKGVGKLLLETLEEFFRAQGCQYSSIEVFAPNENAHRFYLREGYQDRTVYVHKAL